MFGAGILSSFTTLLGKIVNILMIFLAPLRTPHDTVLKSRIMDTCSWLLEIDRASYSH